MLTLVSEHRIYGCHKLKNQGGKCTQWHGHQYKVILTLKAPYKDLDYRNMIMDTYDIEAIFNEFIGVDHLNLNEFMDSEDPTMEEMSKFFYDGLKDKIECLTSVGVYETPETGVTYEPME